MKKTLLATSALALVAATAGAVDVEMYGQVNKGIFGYNDGQDTNVMIVDNDYSTTRMGVKGAQGLDNGLTASVLYEMEMTNNNSASYTQDSAANTGTAKTVGNSASGSISTRQARVGLSGNFGGVYLGQQSVATDGVLGADLAGAQDVMGQDVVSIGGALKFRNKATGKAFNGVTANDLANGTFGDERADSLRYDSPIFAGFQGRASVQQGGDLDLAAFYDGAMGDFKVAGAAGIQYNNNATGAATGGMSVESTQGASLSVAHATGLAATVAYQTESLQGKPTTGDEAESLYAKVGYAWDAFEVAADYSSNENFGTSTASKTDRYRQLDAMGLAAQYNLGNGVSVAGLYRTFDAEVGATTKTPTESIDLYGVNMRVKF